MWSRLYDFADILLISEEVQDHLHLLARKGNYPNASGLSLKKKEKKL